MGINNKINTVEEIGEEALISKLISGDMSEVDFYSDHLRTIEAYHALSYSNLTNFCFPNLTSITGANAFSNNQIKVINFTTMLPALTTIDASQIFNENPIEDIIGTEQITQFGTSSTYQIFGGRGKFYIEDTRHISIQNSGVGGRNTFTNFRHLIFDNLTTLSGTMTDMNIADGNGSTLVEIAEYPSLTSPIDYYSGKFVNTYWLKALIIGNQDSTEIVQMTTTPIGTNRDGVFYGSLIGGNGGYLHSGRNQEVGYIYVADSLVNDYKVATNWSVLGDYIKPLSDYSETFKADPLYIQDSWSTIKQNCVNGNYSQYLNKKKLLVIPNYGRCYMSCIAIDKDILADGTGNAKTTWFMENFLNLGIGEYGNQRMNPAMVSGTVGTGAIGGYANSEMKGLMDDIYDTLNAEDSELHNIITPVKKYTHVYNMDGTGSSTRNHDVESTEYVWLASYGEIFGTSSTTYETKGVTYSDYFTDNASRIKYMHSGASYWWLRSSFAGGSHFLLVSSSGSSSYNDASGSYGIAFGFCI